MDNFKTIEGKLLLIFKPYYGNPNKSWSNIKGVFKTVNDALIYLEEECRKSHKEFIEEEPTGEASWVNYVNQYRKSCKGYKDFRNRIFYDWMAIEIYSIKTQQLIYKD